MGYITTYSGVHLDIDHFNKNDFKIEDIAHALSLVCRANGHVPYFYSVAQHSIACATEAIARGYSNEVILGCLLHDGSEAYLSDIIRPIKKNLSGYKEIEHRFQSFIYELFIHKPLDETEFKLIYEIDDQMLSYEFKYLMKSSLEGDMYQKIQTQPSLKEEKPSKVEKEFLKLYMKYAPKKHRIYTMHFSNVYPLLVAKAEKKGKTKKDVDTIILWLTGYTQLQLNNHLENDSTYEQFFNDASLPKEVNQIKGTICGVKIEEIDDPLMKKVRYLDKLVDDLVKGKKLDYIFKTID